MNIQILLIPIDGETADHGVIFDMPGVPQAGDCVTIERPGQTGSTSFIVRRTFWHLDSPDVDASHPAGERVVGTTSAIAVECEFAVGPYSSEEHKTVAPCAPE